MSWASRAIYYHLGLAYEKLGDKEKAEEYFEDALKEDNTHLNCRLLLNELKAE